MRHIHRHTKRVYHKVAKQIHKGLKHALHHTRKIFHKVGQHTVKWGQKFGKDFINFGKQVGNFGKEAWKHLEEGTKNFTGSIVCGPAKWALEAAKQVLRGAVAAMRAVADAAFEIAKKAIDAAKAVHSAAMSVMAGMAKAGLEVAGVIGVDHFIVEGTLSANFWQSSVAGWLRFHIGSAKIDVSGHFTLGDVGKTIESVFQKAVAWLVKHANPVGLINKLAKAIDKEQKKAQKAGGVAGDIMKGVTGLMKLGQGLMSVLASMKQMTREIDQRFQAMRTSLLNRMMKECQKNKRGCPDAKKFEAQWQKSYQEGEAEFQTKKAEEAKGEMELAEIELMQNKEEHQGNRTDYRALLGFVLDLPIFDDTLDATDAYASKLIEAS